MATKTNQPCCMQNCKEAVITKCLGCPELMYCYKHYAQHRDNLSTEFQRLTDKCNQFLDEVKNQTEKPQIHVLMKTIEDWEIKSIATIKQMAKEVREGLLPQVIHLIPRVKLQLENLNGEIQKNVNGHGFVDTDLDKWSKELERLKILLNNPPHCTIRYESTKFINKIVLEIGTIPHININARWTQKGITVAGGNQQGSAVNQLDRPRGLIIDDDQTVIIADHWNHRIMQWKKDDINGQVVAGGKGQGSQLDQLNGPTDVLIDKETDSLIIADRGNRRVVRWPRYSTIAQGERLIDNIGCWGLALDEKRYLYISDTEKHEVRRYHIGTINGTVVAGGNGQGANFNQLNVPTYLFVDRQQNIYVSDRDNQRVMKWNKGAKLGTVIAGGQGEGSDLTQLYYPQGLFVDTLGTLYVADLRNHRIIRWTKGEKQGTLIVGGNGPGEGENQFNGPIGLCLDRTGNIYVVDYNNHRVQRFSIEQTHENV